MPDAIGPGLSRRAFAAYVAALGGLATAAGTPRSRAVPTPWFVRSTAGPRPTGSAVHRDEIDGGEGVARLLVWPALVLGLVVKYQQNPLRAARALSYLHVAMHDAWLHASAIAPLDAACGEQAAHRAASRMLEQLYPNETPGHFQAQLAVMELRLAEGSLAIATACGDDVAARLVERSLTDGAGRVWPPKARPPGFDGMWQPTYPMFAANPAEGMAPSWRPWVLPDPSRYDPPPPPRPGSERHAAETREVLEVSRALSPGQKRLAEAWHLDAGSVTPAGVWMQRAMSEVKATAGAGPRRAAAQMALASMAALTVTMHDAFVACWRVKMRDWSERPITAVRRLLDPGFVPLLVTPGFPSYVSGHAAVSAAAAGVLSHFFPDRSAGFARAAEEGAASRLWGGIHFRSDNEEGLLLGNAVARDTLRRFEASG